MATAPRRPPPDAGQPKVGERARHQLLVAAGEVFAERGYGQSTSKEICERAGMNSAAVNYHFGGFEALYSEALAHAHQHLLAIEILKDIAASKATARQKLRAVISMIVSGLAFPHASWEMRLISREIISPSPAREAFVKSEVLPKLAVVGDIVASMIGADRDDPVVGRTTLTLLAPGMMLAIMHRDMLKNLMPGIADASEEIEPLIDHIERFIAAGLTAVRAQLRSEHAHARDPRSPAGAQPSAAGVEADQNDRRHITAGAPPRRLQRTSRKWVLRTRPAPLCGAGVKCQDVKLLNAAWELEWRQID